MTARAPASPPPAMPRRVAAVVVAAGTGARLGGLEPKALREIRGRPLVWHAVVTLAAAMPAEAPLVQTLVVAPPDSVGAITDSLVDVPGPLGVLPGGPTRQASVLAGLRVLDPAVTAVLVHDAARPFVTGQVVSRLLDALAAGDPAAVPGLPVRDTVKEVDASGVVVSTLDRAALRAIQTPQAFVLPLLLAAHDAARAAAVVDAVDDALLMERAGHRVRVVPGHEDTFKVTIPDDLARADQVAERWAASS